MLQFDADTAAHLDRAYLGRDFVARRAANLDALAPAPGDVVVDIGAGAGHLTAELSRAVGPDGRVDAVDPSGDMRAVAQRRCADLGNVRVQDGTAANLPLADGTVDGAVSVQVFEYLDDVPAAVTEAYRVLRPGGRLVIGDLDFGSLAWFTENPGRMEQVCAAWDGHFVHRSLPRILPGLLAEAGFHHVSMMPQLCFDRQFRADGLARMMSILMAQYAVGTGRMSQEAVNGWAEEQQRLADAGRFFFALTHYVTVAERPV